MKRIKSTLVLTYNFGSLYIKRGMSFDLAAPFIFDGIKNEIHSNETRKIQDKQGRTAYRIDINRIAEMTFLSDKPRKSFMKSLESLFKVGILDHPDIPEAENEKDIIYVCKGKEYRTVTDLDCAD